MGSVRIRYRDAFAYWTGRQAKFHLLDDGDHTRGNAYEYQTDDGGIVWATGGGTILHEPEREIDGAKDKTVVRAIFQ